MKRWLKRILIAFGILIVLFYAVMLIVPRVVDFAPSQKEITRRFKAAGLELQHHYYEVDGRHMHYAQVGNGKPITIIFVHGSPGEWSQFVDNFLLDTTLLARANLIAVDRPGYGASDAGVAETSIKKQAEEIAPVLEQFKTSSKIILVGHSYGGPVIARLAMDYPQLVDGLLLVAGSISPGEERHQWYNRVAAFWPIKIVMPTDMRISNKEIWYLKSELEDMLPLWKNITVPTIVMQGTADMLVPPANADFAEKVLVNAQPFIVKRYPKTGHLIPFQKPRLMTQEIFRLMDLIER